jgi:fucose permease
VTTVVLAVLVAWATSRLPDGGRRPAAATAPAETPEDAHAVEVRGAAAPLKALGPGSVWFLTTLVAAVALENATTYWSTSLVLERTGADESIATATTAGLIAGMTAMRFVVGPLTRRWHSAHLLAVSFGISVVGWAVLWTATSPAVALAGLAVAGFGYGAQYPLSVALVLGIAREAADRAQAVATFTGGAAVGLAPFILGAVADAVGMHTAFLAVPVLAALGGVGAVLGWRRAHAAALL